MTRYKKKCEKCSKKWRYKSGYKKSIEYANLYMRRLCIREYDSKYKDGKRKKVIKWISIGWICPSCKQVVLDNPEDNDWIKYIWTKYKWTSKQLSYGQEFTEEELKLGDYKIEVIKSREADFKRRSKLYEKLKVVGKVKERKLEPNFLKLKIF